MQIDLTIDCNSSDRVGWLILASFGVVGYVFGIPLLYAYVLRRSRLNESKKNQVVFLTEPYRADLWWFEIFELVRKLFQTSLIVFVLNGSALQLCVMIVISVLVLQSIF
jgi:hypothetical protein